MHWEPNTDGRTIKWHQLRAAEEVRLSKTGLLVVCNFASDPYSVSLLLQDFQFFAPFYKILNFRLLFGLLDLLRDNLYILKRYILSNCFYLCIETYFLSCLRGFFSHCIVQ